ncbi:fumarate reductase [Furfurilactobacillus rossiae]|jgi:NAD(P)H-dependent FMN reductase|nr:fumarate reductase [Furfurilactobacillus rossiae]QLE69982.1 fumarate reductase [Furfurilactobacillus rossiae]
MKLLEIVGTNADKSYNRELLQYMQHHFQRNATIDLSEIGQLPLFKEQPQDCSLPESVQKLANQISGADGVIIGVPEYDHSIPAALKSMIEWLSCTIHPFAGKPIMIVGTSLGIQGTSRAQDEIRRILNAPGVGATVLPGNEFMLSFAPKAFDQSGDLVDRHTISFLESCFKHFQQLIESQKGHLALNVDWNADYDVVVLGFGGAGASAARFAADKGAKTLIVEAAPFGREGGNTRYSAQHVVMGENLADLTDYYHNLNRPFVTP